MTPAIERNRGFRLKNQLKGEGVDVRERRAMTADLKMEGETLAVNIERFSPRTPSSRYNFFRDFLEYFITIDTKSV